LILIRSRLAFLVCHPYRSLLDHFRTLLVHSHLPAGSRILSATAKTYPLWRYWITPKSPLTFVRGGSFLSLIASRMVPRALLGRSQLRISRVSCKETQCLVTKGRSDLSRSVAIHPRKLPVLLGRCANISLSCPHHCPQISGDKTLHSLFSFGRPHALT